MLKLNNKDADLFIPDGISVDQALSRTTHMAIGAHQDDLEIMAYDGILQCYESRENWFTGVVVTNGAGSPRDCDYKNCRDEEMQHIRKEEQKKAAIIGKYGALAQVGYPSAAVKNTANEDVTEDLKNLISASAPKIVYTHNLADKHNTHVAVAIKTINAIRSMPPEKRPEKLYGCEVWRGLDWMMDEDKVLFDVDQHHDLARQLIEVYDSQICGGKRYDLATMGRRLANATYASSHAVDTSQSIIYGMDLTPLIMDASLDISEYVDKYIQRFTNDTLKRINEYC